MFGGRDHADFMGCIWVSRLYDYRHGPPISRMHLGEQAVLSAPKADQELHSLCVSLCKPGSPVSAKQASPSELRRKTPACKDSPNSLPPLAPG